MEGGSVMMTGLQGKGRRTDDVEYLLFVRES